MAGFKPDQRHLTIQGRLFHFVSYEGGSVSRRSPEPAYPAMWYLMVEGHRCPVVPCDPTLSSAELESALATWVLSNALVPVEPTQVPLPAAAPAMSTHRRWSNWWGPA
jgi:hypothetical protein